MPLMTWRALSISPYQPLRGLHGLGVQLLRRLRHLAHSQGLMDSARHVIKRILIPRVLS